MKLAAHTHTYLEEIEEMDSQPIVEDMQWISANLMARVRSTELEYSRL